MNFVDTITNPLFVGVFSAILTVIITVFFTKWLKKIRDNAIKAINAPIKISLKQILGYIFIAFNIFMTIYTIVLIMRSDKPISKMEILFVTMGIGELIVLLVFWFLIKMLNMSIKHIEVGSAVITIQDKIYMRQDEINKLLANAIKDLAETGKGMNSDIVKLIELIQKDTNK